MTEFDPSFDSSIPRQADISQDAIVILPDLVDTIDGDEDLSFMHKTYKRVKYTGQAAVLGLVISPANEAVRLPVAIAAQAHTNNSLVAGTVLGLSTFAFEFTGARNTASLMDTHRGGKVFEWLNDKKEKVGLELAEAFKPDIILLDLMMPEMTGDEMLAELRKKPWGKTVTVIILTNLGEEEAPKTLRELKVHSFIVKAEMTPRQVAERVKAALAA